MKVQKSKLVYRTQWTTCYDRYIWKRRVFRPTAARNARNREPCHLTALRLSFNNGLYIEADSSFKADSCSALNNSPALFKLHVHYYVHKSLPLDPIMSQMNTPHINTLCFRCTLLTSSLLLLGLPSNHFSSDFSTNSLFEFLSHVRATWPTHDIFLYLTFRNLASYI